MLYIFFHLAKYDIQSQPQSPENRQHKHQLVKIKSWNVTAWLCIYIDTYTNAQNSVKLADKWNETQSWSTDHINKSTQQIVFVKHYWMFYTEKSKSSVRHNIQ